MFGYLTPDQGDLRIREMALYRAAYCGICASIKRRYAYPYCALLSYDAVLLASIAGAYVEGETRSPVRCQLNLLAKVDAFAGPAEDYAADVNFLFAYYKCRDDAIDDRRWRAMALERLMRTHAKRAKERLGSPADDCEEALKALSAYESEKSGDLDATSMAWGSAMGSAFRALPGCGRDAVALEALGQHLGRWVYLLDAWDDLDRDEKQGVYNPLICRFGSAAAARAEREHLAWILEALLNNASASAQLLRQDERAPLWRNVIERGTSMRTQAVLQGQRAPFRPVRCHS